jgi:hypothetical protein
MGRTAGRAKETRLLDEIVQVQEVDNHLAWRHFEQLYQNLFLRSSR